MSSSNRTIFLYEDEELQNKFKLSFIKNNQNSYSELEAALVNGDNDHAYRLLHSIKGNAGQARMNDLSQVAAELGALIKNNILPVPAEKMKEFKNELDRVFSELKPLLVDDKANEKNNFLSNEQALPLFGKLKKLLEDSDIECMDHISDLRGISGTEVLIMQIEKYDFADALKTLDKLKAQLN
jgi:HPt (histidine-containing phosphotransfer) domain-containing protein